MFALWWLAGLRGLRRGELCGLRWSDIDLDRGVLSIERNRTTAGYQVIEGDPKTPAGPRAVALDKRSVQILRTARHARDRSARHRSSVTNHSAPTRASSMSCASRPITPLEAAERRPAPGAHTTPRMTTTPR